MPRDAPASKAAATKGYGGNVVVYDRYAEDREAIGRKLAQEHPIADGEEEAIVVPVPDSGVPSAIEIGRAHV